MKKYLMTGIAAVAMCAAFTSCSKDKEFEQITPEQTVQANYDAAFIKAFGQPAANQTWGFGTSATRSITRGSINVNGNMWDTCPSVDTPDEVNAIFNYVNYTLDQMDNEVHHNYSTTAPDNLDGYFVTQVRNGKNADNNYTNKYNGNAAVNEVGGYMNHLQIAFNQNPSIDDLNNSANQYPWGASGWTHINNFNASDNANYGGNTKVENAGAYDFAYHSSFDSKYHNKWILIDGADITSDGKYANYLYVCFDFESTPDNNQTRYSYYDETQKNGGFNGTLNGTFYTENEILAELKNQGITDRSNIVITGWTQQDKMVPGDNKYTDWIVRITKGKPAYDGRIMAEDLSAEESGDFDFNDVVFDYKLNNDETATVKLRAAGGTLELYVGGEANADKTAIVGGHEVHGEFGVGIGTMVNTGVATGTKDPEPFSVACSGNNPINIKIWVKKGTTFMELTAHTGKPASKFQTKTTTKWCDEYISIINPYPSFATWVGSPSVDWTTPFYEKYADKDLTNNEDAIKGRM